MGAVITTGDINRLLRERYCAPEYALFFEVANGTGANIRRYADAMAMSLFPSRGLTMHGFEIKVSRGDWQRELDNPRKVEEGNYRYCDHWWVVATAGIVRDGELPPTWGLIEVNGSGLRQKVAAPKLEPQQMSRSFIAAFLRRADEANTAAINMRVSKETLELREKLAKLSDDNEAAIKQAVDERTTKHRELIERVKKFEADSGISLLHRYDLQPEAACLIRAMKAAGYSRTYGWLEALATQLETTVKNVRGHLEEFASLSNSDARVLKEEPQSEPVVVQN